MEAFKNKYVSNFLYPNTLNCNRRLIKFIQLSNLLLLLLWFLWLMQSKSVDWFLYDNGLRHKRVNEKKRFMFLSKRLCTIEHKIMTDFSKRNSVFGAINWINIFFFGFLHTIIRTIQLYYLLEIKEWQGTQVWCKYFANVFLWTGASYYISMLIPVIQTTSFGIFKRLC